MFLRLALPELVLAMLRTTRDRLLALARSLPLMVRVALSGAAVALVAANVVVELHLASRPQVEVVALPERDMRVTWPERQATFAGRLEESFGIDRERALDFADWILEASTRHDLPPELVASLVHTESSFRKVARSWAGAIGPAQVKPRVWRRFCGDFDLEDPETNVYCGAQVLAFYMRQCGDFECALRLYNVGPGNLRKPHYQEAAGRYLAKIEANLDLITTRPVL